MSDVEDKAAQQEKEQKRWQLVGFLLEWGLESSMERSGGVLAGLSFKIGYDECLLTLKVTFDERPMVAFVSAIDSGRAVAKAARLLKKGELKWRKDEWTGKVDKAG